MNKTILKVSLASAVIGLAFLAVAVKAVILPVVSAGPDQYINSNQSVTLQGFGHNPNGGATIFSWTCSGGSLSNPNIAQPTYTAPSIYQYNNQATYYCTLTANNDGVINTDTMAVYVNNQQQVGGINLQTNSAINISNYQATLQGNLGIPYISNTNYVWFQWGTTNSYGNETTHQSMSSGAFSQNITGLNANTTYHFRAVAQTYSGNTIYGSDNTFYTTGSGTNTNVSVNKKVINLTSGNLNWSESINASPYDILCFAIIIQAGNNQEMHNVYVRDILPQNLIYKGNLLVNASLNYSGNPISGINIGTIPAGEITIISYQAQIAGSQNFNLGSTTLTSTATITSNETGSQTDNATVFVNRYGIEGATDVNTGFTNDLFRDSFFLPLMIILLTAWLYFSGRVYKFADWIKIKITK